jgi:D-glycero-D-manno-heptose 1,7-bisphosphate phosphatase
MSSRDYKSQIADCRLQKSFFPAICNLQSAMARAVFLDRDGVLNRAVVRDGKPYSPATLDELVVLPGVPEALARLRAAGFLLLVATNQPDVARGTQRREVVEAMHARLLETLPLDEVFVCYGDGPDCPTRKPNPGLLLQAAQKYGIHLPASFMVGDRWRDVEAGRRAGCRTVFLDYGYREKRPDFPPDHTARDLADAAGWILTRRAAE